MKTMHKRIIFVLALTIFSLLFYSEDAKADICSSRCWDDRSCSGSDKFAGFNDKNKCPYKVKCCYGYVPSGCTTGSSSAPDCSPPPSPPQPPPGPTRSEIYPSENQWCVRNCWADNGCGGSLSCGRGWDRFSSYCCNSLPPRGSGISCGSCQALPQCNNGIKEAGEDCVTCPQDAGCSAGQRCEPTTKVCIEDPCSRCSSTQQCVNGACIARAEICWNNIDDNGNGQIDENCGGCADLNNDGRVEFKDFFILGDCADLRSPSANCNAEVFNKVDWDDNNFVDAKPEENNEVGGADGKCFRQYWGKNVRCEVGQKQECKVKAREATCADSSECSNGLFCSFGATGRYDTHGKLREGTITGGCCGRGEYWNGRACQQQASREPCTCSYNPFEVEFWNSKNNCLKPNEWVCVGTKLFSPTEEEVKVPI